MLSARIAPQRVAPLERLDQDPARSQGRGPDWDQPIDRTRWFFCETLTPLYYTKSYGTLAPEHRLRYNQLTGMLSNELILRLETGFLDNALGTLIRSNTDRACIELIDAVKRFREDEWRHADSWRRLNRLSEPAWYRTSDRYFLKVPRVVDRIATTLTRHPTACPLVFWIQLAQEERSVDISRHCLRMPAASIEPRYAAVYREHLRDEVRHIQVDCHLIERFHAKQPRAMRQLTATVFRWVLDQYFLRPARSTVRVIETLALEYRELQPLVPQMVAQLKALDSDESYQEMMYSRMATPLTFEMFDAFSEFHGMRRVLRSYTPRTSGRRR